MAKKKTLAHEIERVQKTAERFVINDYSYQSSVTSILKTINWQDHKNTNFTDNVTQNRKPSCYR